MSDNRSIFPLFLPKRKVEIDRHVRVSFNCMLTLYAFAVFFLWGLSDQNNIWEEEFVIRYKLQNSHTLIFQHSLTDKMTRAKEQIDSRKMTREKFSDWIFGSIHLVTIWESFIYVYGFFFTVDSAEIQILNPWVKIPEDWNSGSYSDESSTSSESSYAMSSAQAQYYSSSYGGSDTGTEPFFDHAMMTNLSEHLGTNAFLRCRVKKLGDGTVGQPICRKIYFI